MGRSLLLLALLLPLFVSPGRAALNFRGIWNNLALPRSTPPDVAAPDHLPHDAMPLPPAADGGGGAHGGDSEVPDRPNARVDFGTKAWPFVYYARRDREGTVDWGTKSWPYIFYSKGEEGRDRLGAPETSGAAAAAAIFGRKGGRGFNSNL